MDHFAGLEVSVKETRSPCLRRLRVARIRSLEFVAMLRCNRCNVPSVTGRYAEFVSGRFRAFRQPFRLSGLRHRS
jgi:hypothetical protein